MTPQEDSDSLQIVPDPDKLDRYHRQQLSAMLDGELSPDQARFMLRRLQHDSGLADCWERWQVCGDVLRGQRNELLPPDFAKKVTAALAADGAQVPEARARAGGPRLLRWGGGAALAASVAVAALLVGRQAGIDPEQAPLQAVPQIAASGEAATGSRAPAATDPGPEPSPAAGTAAALAGTALAAAEAPRRAAGRRAAQTQGTEASRRAGDAPRLVAVAAPDPAPARVAPVGVDSPASVPEAAPEGARRLFAGLTPAREGIGSDPFEALPMDVASRPWPSASAAATGYSVGFGNAPPAAPELTAAATAHRQAVAELFGLPPEAALRRLPTATAVGANAIDAGDASAPAPTAADFGPR